MSKQTCPDNLIEQFFNTQSSQDLLAELEGHIAECESCRQKLENASGSKDLWLSLSKAADDQWDDDWSSGGMVVNDCCDSATDQNLGGTQTTRYQTKRTKRILEALKPYLSPSDDPLSTGQVGNYEVTGIIGSGGMGVVLKAREKSLDRVVAIKALLPHLVSDESCRLRFQREAKAAAAVKHPGIISIYRVDVHRELPYFVMPFEVGPSLQQRLEKDGPLSISESLTVAAQIADALSAAHQSGLVHRDIKPSNILLAPGTERALLTDFGLAQGATDVSLTQTGILAGTPPFMSPEQARGETIDHRSDLFSLGSLLYSMLTGHPPVVEENAYKLVRRIGDQKMPQLNDAGHSFPGWLQNLISKLHHLDPSKRFQTAEECQNLINRCLQALEKNEPELIPTELRTKTKSSFDNRFQKKIVATIIVIGLIGSATIPFAMNWNGESIKPAGTKRSTNNLNKPNTDTPSERPQLIHAWEDGLDETVRELNKRLDNLETEETK